MLNEAAKEVANKLFGIDNLFTREMKCLYIDDHHCRHDRAFTYYPNYIIDHVYDFNQAIDAISKTRYDLISFDHDLDGKAEIGEVPKDKTGLDIIQWMKDELDPTMYPFRTHIHSLNQFGTMNMRNLLRSIFLDPTIKSHKVGASYCTTCKLYSNYKTIH